MIVVKPRFVFKAPQNSCINCLTHSQLPVPCQSTKPSQASCGELPHRNGAHVRKQASLDTATLVKRLSGNPVLPSKPRLVSCQNTTPVKQKDQLLQDVLPPLIQKTAVKRRHLFKIKMVNLSEVYKRILSFINCHCEAGKPRAEAALCTCVVSRQ